MLREFLVTNRLELTDRCRSKVSMRRASHPSVAGLEDGIPIFLDRLIDFLPLGIVHTRAPPASAQIASNDAILARDLLRRGFTLDQVVHGYGELCLSIVELALTRDAPITVEEFGALMTRLDNAIAASVTEHAEREMARADDAATASDQRLSRLAHEMRNLLNTATLAISMIKTGSVGFGGSTAAALDRSLVAMSSLLDRALDDVDVDLEAKATLPLQER